MLDQAVEAARAADAAVLVVGSGPATESEGFDRPGLALPGRQDELVRRVAAVNDRTIVVVNAGMPVLMPWADQVAAIGYAWLPGQAMGTRSRTCCSARPSRAAGCRSRSRPPRPTVPCCTRCPTEDRLEYRRGAAGRLPRVRPRRGETALPVRPRPGLHHLGVRVGGVGRAGSGAGRRPRRNRRAPQHRPADRARGRPGLPGAADGGSRASAARAGGLRLGHGGTRRARRRPGSPCRPGRSPATTRRPEPLGGLGSGSARRASSPSASAGHQLTCLFTCGLNHFDAERTWAPASGHPGCRRWLLDRGGAGGERQGRGRGARGQDDVPCSSVQPALGQC